MTIHTRAPGGEDPMPANPSPSSGYGEESEAMNCVRSALADARPSPAKGEAGSGSAESALVREVLTAVLPPNVPPSFREIVSARTEGRGKAREVVAALVMVDGLPATVRLRPWAHGWSHQFTDMPGGALSYEGSAWVRAEAMERAA